MAESESADEGKSPNKKKTTKQGFDRPRGLSCLIKARGVSLVAVSCEHALKQNIFPTVFVNIHLTTTPPRKKNPKVGCVSMVEHLPCLAGKRFWV